MKKRSLFISVFLGVVFVATAAFAYFTFSQTVSGNTVTSGELKFTVWQSPLDARNLMPGGTANVSYIAIRNDSPVQADFKAWVDGFDAGSTLGADKVNVKITMNPSTPNPWGLTDTFSPAADYPVGVAWGGPTFKLSDLQDPNSHKLASVYWNGSADVKTPIQPGQIAVYKVEVSLDASADNGYANKWLMCNFNWAGYQVEDTTWLP
jgi:hypothetical protein